MSGRPNDSDRRRDVKLQYVRDVVFALATHESLDHMQCRATGAVLLTVTAKSASCTHRILLRILAMKGIMTTHVDIYALRMSRADPASRPTRGCLRLNSLFATHRVRHCACIMLSNHELEDVGMVFPNNFRIFGIPSINMVVCSFVSFCVDIPYVHGDL